MATRGARPERRDDGIHYPGTYLSGVYNRTTGIIHGRELEEEHLVNIPNWLPVDVRIGDGPWWSTGEMEVSEDRSELDLRRGTVGIRAGIDAQVTNTNVRDYIGSGQANLTNAVVTDIDDHTVLSEVETNQSQIRIALAVCTEFPGQGVTASDVNNGGGRYLRNCDVQLVDGETATMTKTVAVATSRDVAIASPGRAALTELSRNEGDFDILIQSHEAAWRRLWDRFEVTFDGDRQSQLSLNLHVFHLLQAISEHTAELDAGVPARGLHGEGYRGHIFWDELFILPVIGLRLPQVSQTLLEYRWQWLGAARAAARAQGLKGALFPWQSGSDGREETPQ